ncbi:MAG TPA: hypothetical protein VEJ84_09735, partial [Acidimicrobiales bacterium]|nr:hypothetical protein [Acidimicrobiales bacterium]
LTWRCGHAGPARQLSRMSGLAAELPDVALRFVAPVMPTATHMFGVQLASRGPLCPAKPGGNITIPRST